jgi:PAS domain-containing protein
MASATDPFVLYHTVYPGVLELNGRASPGSIRDQFIRGVLAVDGLIGAGLLQPGESLLVVGAGFAGVSAALRAAERQVSVSLVDQAQAPLSLLSANKRRVISPTIFDWPSKHWQDSRFEGIFLYQEGTPYEVCNNLLAAVGQAQSRDNSLLHFYPKVKWIRVEPSTPLGPPWRCDFEAGGSGGVPSELQDQVFHAVLLCSGIGGPGEESLDWKDHSQPFPFFTFWKNDPWPDRNQPPRFIRPISRQAHGESAQVAIVGAGDGGIQDLIRFLTGGRGVRELLYSLQSSLGPADNEWIATLYRTFDDEDAFRRRDVYWKTPNTLLSEWHSCSREEVARFYHGDSSRQQRIRDALKKLIVFTDVLIFQQEPSLGRCYAVNRFLALLLERYLEQEGQHGSPFRYGRTALLVECGDHERSDSSKPIDHCDGEHRLLFRDTDGVVQTVLCRTVVLRIGARLPSPLRKEMLPYWLPDWGPPSRMPKQPSMSHEDGRKGEMDTEPVRNSENLPAFLLQTDQAWCAAVWTSLIGTAVLKDQDGCVFAYNPRFAWLTEEKRRSEIIGRRPSEYWKKETGATIEEHDRDVRTNARSLATCEILRRNSDPPTTHRTFRFPLPLGDGSIGSASLGIQDMIGKIVTIPSTGQTLPLPSPAELERFFENMPLWVTVCNQSHCFVYANAAFCRGLIPGSDLLTARRSIYGNTLDELLQGKSPGEDDANNERKNTIWQSKKTRTWRSHPVFGAGFDFAVGFPVFDEYEQMIGLATIRLPWRAMTDLHPTAGVLNSIDLQSLIPNER